MGEVERERGSSRQQKKSYGEIQVQKCCEICVLFRASFSSGNFSVGCFFLGVLRVSTFCFCLIQLVCFLFLRCVFWSIFMLFILKF